ncbi:DUF305 domain-containing protein [Streptomyces sp. 891-h]|uniref:DUF305 domain-containing protein n=1 Tax=unclassified Streptomyces TaxID=2593676 RepID=UPI001FA98F6C|nr:DUF305 domain-containing protein [Streptomyces sp. 891-h]
MSLALTALPALTGCTSGDGDGTKEKKTQAGPSVIAPGEPGESARTLSPEKARQKSGGGHTAPNSADFTYITMMIEHHEQAVVMSKLAPKRAADSDVRKLASRIKAAQGPEIKAMRGWLEQHDDSGHTDHGGSGGGKGHAAMPGMATGAQLAQLRKARGRTFDRLFLTLMTTHHKGAVTMAVQALKDGNDVRVEEMATEVVAQQRAEIKRMRQLRH